MTRLSILIPTLNSCEMLKNCLRSIEGFAPPMSYEIIIADNGSTDGTLEFLSQDYPHLTLIKFDKNEGFAKPVNKLLNAAQGDYLVLLNPDTLLIEDVFSPQLDWLDEHDEVGISIPKVLNADGSFQAQCKRGDARPAAVFGYFLKLGKLFPKNRSLNSYLMSWLDEDEIAEVDAVSGSCMIIRRACWEAVGDFDKTFFAYQEDSDYCIRPRQKGWTVLYLPISSIIHFGGQGGS
ncbi:MAG: glycosyltransferase family 2 protein, partial [Chloroflexi bacterium]|nr:glycosyltransferase family 2 protein [Chloroflexota bacterium]